MVTSQNAEIIKKVEAQMPELIGKINEGVSKDFNVDLALKMSQMLPLPVHEESARSMSYSTYVQLTGNPELGITEPVVTVATTTFVLVKDKVIFLYAYGPEDQLEWSRAASKDWAAKLFAANGVVEESVVEESWGGFFDWRRIVVFAVIGGIIGGLYGRRKAKK